MKTREDIIAELEEELHAYEQEAQDAEFDLEDAKGRGLGPGDDPYDEAYDNFSCTKLGVRPSD